MSYEITWDQDGSRFYETGVNHGVLYPYVGDVEAFSTSATYAIGDIVTYEESSVTKIYMAKEAISTAGAWDATKWVELKSKYAPGVAWNGLTSVTESPSGAEATDLYADNIKYLSLRSAEDFGLTIEAYTYPDEFDACNGLAELATGAVVGQQSRKAFGVSYITTVGNDETSEYSEKLHIVYGCTASPSDKAYSTINDSPEAITFSWEISTIPVTVTGFKPTAAVTVDKKKATTAGWNALIAALHGTSTVPAYLPMPAEVATLLATTQAAG